MSKLPIDCIYIHLPVEPKTSAMKKCLCPSCGFVFVCATSVSGDLQHVPTEGMISLCGNCAAINIFTSDLAVRSATPEEIAAIMSDETLRKLIQNFQTFRRGQGPTKQEKANA